MSKPIITRAKTAELIQIDREPKSLNILNVDNFRFLVRATLKNGLVNADIVARIEED